MPIFLNNLGRGDKFSVKEVMFGLKDFLVEEFKSLEGYKALFLMRSETKFPILNPVRNSSGH